MRYVNCSICGGKLVKNGKLKNGKQIWYCKKCSLSSTIKHDNAVKNFNEFLSWLLGSKHLKDYPGGGRTF